MSKSREVSESCLSWREKLSCYCDSNFCPRIAFLLRKTVYVLFTSVKSVTVQLVEAICALPLFALNGSELKALAACRPDSDNLD
jgi:hypothetical protein